MGIDPTFMDKTSLVLKGDELGRVRTPRDRRLMLIEEFRRSKLSASKFALLEGVAYNRFWKWLREQGLTAKRGSKLRPAKPRLVEVCLLPLHTDGTGQDVHGPRRSEFGVMVGSFLAEAFGREGGFGNSLFGACRPPDGPARMSVGGWFSCGRASLGKRLV